MEVINSKHIGCYGIVINDKNEVLLIKKAKGAYKGKLDLPGGGIEYGERPEEALKREFIEEIGLEIESFSLYKVITYYVTWNISDTKQEKLQHLAVIYKVKLNELELDKIKMDADGHDSLGANWYDIDKLSLEELSPLAKVIKD